MSEISIKASLVDNILLNTSPTVIALEFPFLDGSRRADLVSVYCDSLCAYEIKSSKDNLDKLEGQIKDYTRSFEQVCIVADTVHIKEVTANCPRRIGIYEYSNGIISLRRKPIKIKRLSKFDSLLIMNKKSLEKEFQKLSWVKFDYLKKYSKIKIVEEIAKKTSLTSIRALVISYVAIKYEQRFNHFLHERGTVTNLDDLTNLTIALDVKLP